MSNSRFMLPSTVPTDCSDPVVLIEKISSDTGDLTDCLQVKDTPNKPLTKNILLAYLRRHGASIYIPAVAPKARGKNRNNTKSKKRGNEEVEPDSADVADKARGKNNKKSKKRGKDEVEPKSADGPDVTEGYCPAGSDIFGNKPSIFSYIQLCNICLDIFGPD